MAFETSEHTDHEWHGRSNPDYPLASRVCNKYDNAASTDIQSFLHDWVSEQGLSK